MSENTTASFAAHAKALYEALEKSKKSVKIEISSDDLETLKGSNYKLCFAKKVGDGYNVVWQSYTKYLMSTTFSWTPQYQLFGTNLFQDGVEVQVSTNLVTIGIGDVSTLDSAGVLSPAKTGGDPAAINMHNDYGSIHPGLNQMSTGIDGQLISMPIYVAPDAIVTGEASLTPVEMVQVWFEQNIRTGTMFSSARSRAVEIDLTEVNSATRLYKDETWTTP